MNALDEYDIREAFEALDDDKEGLIDLRDLETIFVGLGYEYRPRHASDDEIGKSSHQKLPTLAELREEVRAVAGAGCDLEALTLDKVLQILSKVSDHAMVFVLCPLKQHSVLKQRPASFDIVMHDALAPLLHALTITHPAPTKRSHRAYERLI